jgi:hypothetical protein
MTETRQNLSQQVKGRRGRAIDKAWAHRMLLLRGGDTLGCRAALRLEEVFALDDPTGTLQAVWKVKEQLRTGSLDDGAAARKVLEELVTAAARPETNRLRWCCSAGDVEQARIAGRSDQPQHRRRGLSTKIQHALRRVLQQLTGTRQQHTELGLPLRRADMLHDALTALWQIA